MGLGFSARALEVSIFFLKQIISINAIALKNVLRCYAVLRGPFEKFLFSAVSLNKTAQVVFQRWMVLFHKMAVQS